MKKLLGIAFLAMGTTLATLALTKNYFAPHPLSMGINSTETPIIPAVYSPGNEGGGYVNLEDAAERSSKAVVHIKTEIRARAVQYRHPFFDDFFDQFFGGQGGGGMYSQPQQSSGSGVCIITARYTGTNNHVVDQAD